MARNPPWVEDELLVVLELYLAVRRVLEEHDVRVVEASQLLNRLPIHAEAGRQGFRTPDAVVLRLANFRSYDPTTTAKGMRNEGRTDAAVWQRYADDPATVQSLVGVIRSIAEQQRMPDDRDADDSLKARAPEGVLIYRTHRVRERSSQLRARKLKQLAASSRRPACEVCGLVPELLFRYANAAVLECHHVSPLRLGNRLTALTDVALVCANCIERCTPGAFVAARGAESKIARRLHRDAWQSSAVGATQSR